MVREGPPAPAAAVPAALCRRAGGAAGGARGTRTQITMGHAAGAGLGAGRRFSVFPFAEKCCQQAARCERLSRGMLARLVLSPGGRAASHVHVQACNASPQTPATLERWNLHGSHPGFVPWAGAVLDAWSCSRCLRFTPSLFVLLICETLLMCY